MLDRSSTSRRRWPSALLALLLLVLSGRSVSVEAQPIQPPAVPAGPGSASNSPFVGDGDPLAEARALLEWTGGGSGYSGTSCSFRVDGSLVMSSPKLDGPREIPCSIAVNGNVRIRVDESVGGSSDELTPPAVRIRRPDGQMLDQVPDEDGDPIWWIGLGSPLGQYAVTARHGDRDLVGSFAVTLRDELADRPYPIMRVWPRVGPPGTQFRAALAGFTPRQEVSLYVYLGQRGANPTFLSSLATVRVDDRGEATYAVPTRPSDPEGLYLLVSSPMSLAADLLGAQLVISTTPDYDNLMRGRPWSWQEDRAALERLARAIVVDANRTWASVVAKDGRPLVYLACVYDGEVLADAMSSEKGRRTRGEHRVASMTRPIEIRDVKLVGERVVGGRQEADGIEVTVTETWDDRTYDAGGRVIRDSSGRSDFRYLMRYEHPSSSEWAQASRLADCDRSGWWIFKAESLGPR
jgi:hypothetical protein